MACLCFDVQSVSMDAPIVGFFLAPWQSWVHTRLHAWASDKTGICLGCNMFHHQMLLHLQNVSIPAPSVVGYFSTHRAWTGTSGSVRDLESWRAPTVTMPPTGWIVWRPTWAGMGQSSLYLCHCPTKDFVKIQLKGEIRDQDHEHFTGGLAHARKDKRWRHTHTRARLSACGFVHLPFLLRSWVFLGSWLYICFCSFAVWQPKN